METTEMGIFRKSKGISPEQTKNTFIYFSVKKKFRKLQDSQNRSKMTILKWGVDGFSYFIFYPESYFLLQQII
jgi:hypothetical protein